MWIKGHGAERTRLPCGTGIKALHCLGGQLARRSEAARFPTGVDPRLEVRGPRRFAWLGVANRGRGKPFEGSGAHLQSDQENPAVRSIS